MHYRDYFYMTFPLTHIFIPFYFRVYYDPFFNPAATAHHQTTDPALRLQVMKDLIYSYIKLILIPQCTFCRPQLLL